MIANAGSIAVDPIVANLFAGLLHLEPIHEPGVTGERFALAAVENSETFRRRLEAEGNHVGWFDLMHYLPLGVNDDERVPLAKPPFHVDRKENKEPFTASTSFSTRILNLCDDADTFATFQSMASQADRDDSEVELDHWAVAGVFMGDQLVAAASAYPWRGTKIADIGVLVLPDHRRRGLGANVVKHLAHYCQTLGYTPQYRCSPDNTASAATARACGFIQYGFWAVLT